MFNFSLYLGTIRKITPSIKINQFSIEHYILNQIKFIFLNINFFGNMDTE